jgi:trans-2,3-dihydro-3-hydroxyanthranilate isomerase
MPPSGVHADAAEINDKSARDSMRLPFATLDVFTERRFAGNPLAVVFEADGLAAATMQAIAREFSHPETVFVLKPDQPGNTARARIFTPAREMPFAGHPTVGTALVLSLRRGAGTEVNLEEKIGLVKCRVAPEGGDRGRASFVIPSLPERSGDAASRDAIAAALRLATDDIGFAGHKCEKWSAGNGFTFVPLRNIDAVRRCRIDDARWDAAFDGVGAFVFSDETEATTHDFHARMFAPRAGVREDPATGSAAAAFAGFCANNLSLADGEHHFTIEQGYEMGRPSLIELGITMRNGALAAAIVGGPAIIVTEGTIEA